MKISDRYSAEINSIETDIDSLKAARFMKFRMLGDIRKQVLWALDWKRNSRN